MISIIIPTYNEEKYIEETLVQFTNGLTLPYELIVTDDKSTDATVALAQKYTAIVLVPEKKHRAIGANRNAGAARATSDIVVFIDASSRLGNRGETIDTFFKKALAHFDKNPNLVALTGSLWVLPQDETFGDKVVYTFFNWVHRFKNNILGSGEASGKFQMIRKTAFEKAGGFREDLITREDADMFQRLSKIGDVHCDASLQVFHNGRRAHAIGWPKLLWIWGINSVWFSLFNKSYTQGEWKEVR